MPKAVSRKYKSKFLKEWLNIAKYKLWLQECPSDSDKAFCKVCNSEFDMSNIGISSMDSHAKGLKHQKRMAIAKSYTQSNNITSFFHNKTQSSRPSQPGATVSTNSSSLAEEIVI